MRIYKVFRAAEWAELTRAGETPGSPDDQRDGFIHFSTRDQLGGTLSKHFKGEHNLILAAVETDNLEDSELKWEAASNGNEYPHLYGMLTIDKVVWHHEIPRDGIDTMALGEE